MHSLRGIPFTGHAPSPAASLSIPKSRRTCSRLRLHYARSPGESKRVNQSGERSRFIAMAFAIQIVITGATLGRVRGTMARPSCRVLDATASINLIRIWPDIDLPTRLVCALLNNASLHSGEPEDRIDRTCRSICRRIFHTIPRRA